MKINNAHWLLREVGQNPNGSVHELPGRKVSIHAADALGVNFGHIITDRKTAALLAKRITEFLKATRSH